MLENTIFGISFPDAAEADDFGRGDALLARCRQRLGNCGGSLIAA
jgi:hypothetical protein